MTNLETGRSERLLPTLLVTSYDLDRNDRIVAGVRDRDGRNRVWTGSLDGREASRQIPNVEGDNPRWAGERDIVFRGQDGPEMFLFRTTKDGSGMRKLSTTAVVGSALGSASSDAKWLSGLGVSESSGTTDAVMIVLFSMNDATTIPLLRSVSGGRVRWSPDGKHVYLSVALGGAASALATGRTYVLPTEGATMLPRIPAGGFRSETELAAVQGVVVLPYGDVAPGSSVSSYAFSRETVTRNLYRIPLP